MTTERPLGKIRIPRQRTGGSATTEGSGRHRRLANPDGTAQRRDEPTNDEA